MKPGGTGFRGAGGCGPGACGRHRLCCRARAACGSDCALIYRPSETGRDGGTKEGDERSGGRCFPVRLR